MIDCGERAYVANAERLAGEEADEGESDDSSRQHRECEPS
jgi:hypothetical protein